MTQRDNSEQKPGSCETLSESEIDESLAETFPASDAPPWTLGVEPHCHPENNEPTNQPAQNSRGTVPSQAARPTETTRPGSQPKEKT